MSHRPNVTLFALTFAAAAYALQQTMVLPALPTLGRDLHTTTAWTTWTFTSFLLVSSVATPLLGKLGDQFGKQRLLVISLSVFFAGCVGAALAWNAWSLIAFRGVQGLGGAVFPLGYAIVKDEFPADRVGTGVGLMSSVIAVGAGLGLVLSGLLLEYLSWRAIFVAGAIAVCAAALLVHALVPESPIKTPTRLDLRGALLLSVGLVALLLGMTEGPAWGWGSTAIVGLFALSAAALAVWVGVELRTRQPLIDLRMFTHRVVAFTNLAALFAGVPVFASGVLVIEFVQASHADAGYGFDASATQAGLLMLPGVLLGLLSGWVAAGLGRRFGSKWPLSLGMLLTAAGIAWLAGRHDERWEIVVGMAFTGLGVPLSYAGMAKLIVDAVRATETAVASGVNVVIRTIGGLIGAQLAATILSAHTLGVAHLPRESAYVAALRVTAVSAAVAALLALCVTRRGGGSTAPPRRDARPCDGAPARRLRPRWPRRSRYARGAPR
jgi:EmrB/QacA subfamily drug resistance transporter